MIRNIFYKVMNREVISYLVFGVLTTLVNWAVYWLMVRSGIEYWAATAAAWVVSVLFAFIVNKIFVFQSHDLHLNFVVKEFLSFTGCRAASGVMEMVLMLIMVSWLNFGEYVSKILVSVAVLAANYGFSKVIIFRKRAEEPL